MATLGHTDVWNSSMSTHSSPDLGTQAKDLPLYIISSYIWYVCPPVITFFGTFGNVMTIIIMQRITTEESVVNLYFTGIAITDLMSVHLYCFRVWLGHTFGYDVITVHESVCKVITWIYASTGSMGCWFLVCLTLHRAMSVVWPHRVNILCTRRTVMFLITGIVLFLALVYSSYLYGFTLVWYPEFSSYFCTIQSPSYAAFLEGVFSYINLTIYSALPFVCIVLGNSILVWALAATIRESRHQFAEGNSEQVAARERAATSVTLTVIVVSTAFVLLTLPASIYYVVSYMALVHRNRTPYEEAQNMFFYAITYMLMYTNSAVNFYLYCLTGRRFRQECVKVLSIPLTRIRKLKT